MCLSRDIHDSIDLVNKSIDKLGIADVTFDESISACHYLDHVG